MASGIEYHVRAILEAQASAASTAKIQGWAKSVEAASKKVENFGRKIAGTAAATAAAFAKVGAAATAAAGAYGMLSLVRSGMEFNKQLQNMQYSMASTLQLFGHAQADFNKNLQIAEEVQKRLFLIAAKSPASFEQASQLFTNMLPGARAVTADLEDILDLTRKSLALGIINEEDFALTGSQLSRILTGGAGAEMETWRKILQKPILQAGKAMGYFDENLALGMKLTEKFNQLRPEQRWELVKMAVEELGTATEELGKTWAGTTSTIASNFQILKKELTGELFQALTGEFKVAVAEGGILDPEGKTMAKLRDAAGALGNQLGRLAAMVAGPLTRWIEDFASNWRFYLDRAFQWVDAVWAVTKAFAKVAVLRTVAGGMVMGVGKVGGMVSMLMSGVNALMPVLGALGMGVIWLTPLIAALGFAFAGAGAMVAGVAAYVMSSWDEVVAAVRAGAVTLEPVLFAIDDMWARLKALGKAILGTSDTAGVAQKVIDAVAEAFHFMTGAMSAGLRVIGWVVRGWNWIQYGIKGIYDALLAMVEGLSKAVLAVAEWVPGMGITAERTKKDLALIARERQRVAGSMAQDLKEAERVMEWADAFDNASVEASSALTEGIRDGLRNFQRKEERRLTDLSGGDLTTKGGAGGRRGPAAGRTIRVEKMIVNQDLRGMDPDRVIGAFYREVERAIEKRTGSLALEEMGV